MLHLFSDEFRRNPFPVYQELRSRNPVAYVPPPFDLWMILDYNGVKQALADHDTFSSRVPGPKDWFLFDDPPRHTRLRALIARAFSPRVVANLEPHIGQLSRQLLDQALAGASDNEWDLATDYSVPLPMMVIAEMIGIPPADWPRFKRWSDMILKLSYTLRGMENDVAESAMNEFRAVTAEMDDYLSQMIELRKNSPTEDLISGLVQAEVDGQRLSRSEILGFFQLLVVGGQETTTNLINNAVLCLLENPYQLSRLQENLALLPSAIEEVLRYRSPLQWLMRTPTRPIQLRGQTIEAGKLVLTVIGSANRDPQQFLDAEQFDISRHPNPHLAFGLGVHFCLGAPLARVEARVALTDLLMRVFPIELAGDQAWEPRKALHVLGPARLPVPLPPVARAASMAL